MGLWGRQAWRWVLAMKCDVYIIRGLNVIHFLLVTYSLAATVGLGREVVWDEN